MKIKKATARMMMNQQAKWRKQAEKPAKWNEGYAGVTYEDVWNLNDRLASSPCFSQSNKGTTWGMSSRFVQW